MSVNCVEGQAKHANHPPRRTRLPFISQAPPKRRKRPSHGPAGTAERAPEAFEIRDRELARPGRSVVVTVDAAAIVAAAAHRRLSSKRGSTGAVRIAPGGIAAEPTDR